MQTPELIAHRGHAAVCPENTRAALDSALTAGARFVEVDVQLSKDGVPFLFHDRTLSRMCAVDGALGDRTAAQLRELRAAESGRFGARFASEPIATLDDLVECAAAHPQAFAFVELKRASLERVGPNAVLDAVLPRLAGLANRCALISFDLAVLREARRRCDLPVGAVFDRFGDVAAGALGDLKVEFVFADLFGLPADRPLTVPGAAVAVYEVADPAAARALAARGVRFVETFDFARMQAGLASAQPRGEGAH